MGFLDMMERELILEAAQKEELNKKFIVKLMNYLESIFPDYGQFSQNMTTELKAHMKIGTEEKAKELKKVRKKIHEIITKEKMRFLNNVQNKVERIQVTGDEIIQKEEPTDAVSGENEDGTQAEYRHDS